MPFYYGPAIAVKRVLQRVLSDVYDDPFFRLEDPSILHFPLQLTGSALPAPRKEIRYSPSNYEPRWSPKAQRPTEFIQIEDSDDEDDRVVRRTSIVDTGKKRKIRHEHKRADKKRERQEEPEQPVEVEAAATQPAPESPTAAKRAKVDANDSEKSAMDVDESTNSLFGWKPQVNLEETAEVLVFEARLPGFGKDDVSIDLDEYDGAETPFLKFTARKKVETQEPLESTSVKFTRLIPVPKAIPTEGISAVWDQGVLRVTVKKPKVEAQTSTPVSIPIAATSS